MHEEENATERVTADGKEYVVMRHAKERASERFGVPMAEVSQWIRLCLENVKMTEDLYDDDGSYRGTAYDSAVHNVRFIMKDDRIIVTLYEIVQGLGDTAPNIYIDRWERAKKEFLLASVEEVSSHYRRAKRHARVARNRKLKELLDLEITLIDSVGSKNEEEVMREFVRVEREYKEANKRERIVIGNYERALSRMGIEYDSSAPIPFRHIGMDIDKLKRVKNERGDKA